MSADFSLFYCAAVALLKGISPYTVTGFFSPVWALVPFIPLTILPIQIAQIVYIIATTLGTLWALKRFGLKPLPIAIVMIFSPLLWVNLVTTNVDWIVLLGASFSPKWGVWLCGMKPQVSFGVLGLWTWQKQWKPLLLIGAALVANYAIFGLPNLHAYNNGMFGMENGFSASLFPIGIPLAVYWFILAIRRSDTGTALALSALCSPYYSFSSAISLSPLAKNKRGILLVLILSWLLFLLYKFSIKL